MRQHISLDQLKPGMFLVGMDQSWWNTPFLLHHRYIKNETEIHRLRQAGVRGVVIDTSKGLGLEESPSIESTNLSPLAGQEPADFSNSDQKELNQEELPPNEARDMNGAPTPLDMMECSDPESPASDRATINPSEQAQRVRESAVRAVEQVFEGVRSGQPLNNPLLEKTAQGLVQHVLNDAPALPQLILIQNLLMVEKNLYTHVVDVCALSVVLGIEMGWTEQDLRAVAMGSLLHDIGYARLPNNLVRNRKHATESDWVLLTKHSEVGHSVINANTDLSSDVKTIVVEHHERLDGSGTPHGLQGDQISPLSQVVALVDQFDKVTSNWGMGPLRPAALVLRELYQEAQEGRFLLRPIERLIHCLGVYPVGSLVELSTGEWGIVVMTNSANLLKPKIKLIVRSDRAPYPVPLVVDLANPDPDDPHRSIRSLLDAQQEQIHIEKYVSVGV